MKMRLRLSLSVVLAVLHVLGLAVAEASVWESEFGVAESPFGNLRQKLSDDLW
jgi:hypothetical protein